MAPVTLISAQCFYVSGQYTWEGLHSRWKQLRAITNAIWWSSWLTFDIFWQFSYGFFELANQGVRILRGRLVKLNFCSHSYQLCFQQNSHILIKSLLVRTQQCINFLDGWTGWLSKGEFWLVPKAVQILQYRLLILAMFFSNSWHKINSILFGKDLFVFMFGGQFQRNVYKTGTRSMDFGDESIYQQTKKSHYKEYLNELYIYIHCIMFSWVFRRILVNKLVKSKRARPILQHRLHTSSITFMFSQFSCDIIIFQNLILPVLLRF